MSFAIEEAPEILAGSPASLHATLGGLSDTLEQPLATWTVHNLDHPTRIVKTLAKRYRDAIGPWRGFLPVVDLP